jgi:hypothetical protein
MTSTGTDGKQWLTWASLLMLVACGEPAMVIGDRSDEQLGSVASELADPACFGRAPFTICLPAVPLTLLSIASPTTTTIDTDSSPMCSPIVSGGDACVLAGSIITIKSKLRATGSRPLVLIASLAIVASAPIDVGSHRGEHPETGAGADPAICATMAGVPPELERGGAGGSFFGRGGAGCVGGEPGDPVPVTGLRGGCAGQASDSIDGVGGHGGGAVMLIAARSILVDTDITASGEGGGQGGTILWAGGAGGGAGGMIVLDAPTVTVTGMLLANGGGGGEGTGAGEGNPGADPSDITAARGGNGGSFAGDGGDGAAGVIAGPGADGLCGQGRDGGGGTGGGGGGAGLIMAPASAALGARVSPPAMAI